MSGRGMLVAMAIGTVAMVWVVSRHAAPEHAPRSRPHRIESPWLTHEAAAELIGPDGTLGPLFAEVTLGGLAPEPEVRAQIDEFARANGVQVRFEIVDDELVAIRLDVSFGGCCGYEGADVLALRLQRPSTGRCFPIYFGQHDTWINDWSRSEDGINMHASVRVNRVAVRWERDDTLPELLERADRLVGVTTAAVRGPARARDRIGDADHEPVMALDDCRERGTDAADGAIDEVSVQHGAR
jgi:hypothetical protein